MTLRIEDLEMPPPAYGCAPVDVEFIGGAWLPEAAHTETKLRGADGQPLLRIYHPREGEVLALDVEVQ